MATIDMTYMYMYILGGRRQQHFSKKQPITPISQKNLTFDFVTPNRGRNNMFFTYYNIPSRGLRTGGLRLQATGQKVFGKGLKKR